MNKLNTKEHSRMSGS